MNYYTQSSRVQGVGGLWSWLTGTDLAAEQTRGENLDVALLDENIADLASGHYTQSIYDIAEAHRLGNLTGNVEQQVQDTFVDSVRSDLASAAGFATDAIPWQLYAVGAAAIGLSIFSKK